MNVISINRSIVVEFSQEDTIKYFEFFESSFPKPSKIHDFACEFFLSENKDMIESGQIELEFDEVDSAEISNSKLRPALFKLRTIQGDLESEIPESMVVSSGLLLSYEQPIIQVAQELNLVNFSFELFKQYCDGKESNEVFNTIIENEIRLDFPVSEAVLFLNSNIGQLDNRNLDRFIRSEHFTKEDSILIIENEKFVPSTVEGLKEIVGRKISEEAEKVLCSRYIENNKDIPLMTSYSYFMEALKGDVKDVIVEDISFDDFVSMVSSGKYLVSVEDTITPLEKITLESPSRPAADVICLFAEYRSVDQKQLVNLITGDFFHPGYNKILIDRTDIIIHDVRELNKIQNVEGIEEDTVKILHERATQWFSKDNQIKLAVEFQRYYNGEVEIPNTKPELSAFVEKTTVLYSLVKEIDENVSQGIFKNYPVVADCEFDSNGFPLVANQKINYVLTQAIKRNDGAPADLIQYYAQNEQIEFEGKIQVVIEHPNCPQRILDQYSEDREYFASLIRNPALPQLTLQKIVDQLGADDVHLFKSIINHPNCTEEMKEILLATYPGFLNRIATSDNSEELDVFTRKLLAYPNNWKEKFDLDLRQKHEAIRAIMKNSSMSKVAMDQILEFYTGIESDISDIAKELRSFVLVRRDTPDSFVTRMIESGVSSIRLEAIDFGKIVNEDLIDIALNVALFDFSASIGEFRLSSKRVLEADLNVELKSLEKNAPVSGMVYSKIRDKIVESIKIDIQTAVDLPGLKTIYTFLEKNDSFLGEIQIGEEIKNELLKELKARVSEVKVA